MHKSLSIVGIRGVPAAHGGFETFAERLVVYLKARSWDVAVYCQEDGNGSIWEDHWQGVRRIHIPVAGSGPASTVLFDWKAIALAAKDRRRQVLTLGYNTAVFSARLRLAGVPNTINMDGIEWRREKWTPVAKAWFWMNDWAGCWLGDQLIADHPEIRRHLRTRVRDAKITTIPYGADSVTQSDEALIKPYGIRPKDYAILVARAEPENSVLEVVRAWSRKPRGAKLLVLGKYESGRSYHEAVRHAASDEVLFPGAIYDRLVVQALRFYARFYVHGHKVGGTNPSLVEALGAGNAILAHNNPYNRWVAGPDALYFANEDECAKAVDRLLSEPEITIRMSQSSRQRHLDQFTWPRVLQEYEALLDRHTRAPGL